MEPEEIGKLVLAAIVFSVACWLGFLAGKEDMRDEAVEANAAEYYIDEKHEKKFRWKQ